VLLLAKFNTKQIEELRINKKSDLGSFQSPGEREKISSKNARFIYLVFIM
jgi:hypothetical protein